MPSLPPVTTAHEAMPYLSLKSLAGRLEERPEYLGEPEQEGEELDDCEEVDEVEGSIN